MKNYKIGGPFYANGKWLCEATITDAAGKEEQAKGAGASASAALHSLIANMKAKGYI